MGRNFSCGHVSSKYAFDDNITWCRLASDSQELKQNYFEDLLDDPEDRIFGAFVLGKYEEGKTFRSVRSDIKLKCRKI